MGKIICLLLLSLNLLLGAAEQALDESIAKEAKALSDKTSGPIRILATLTKSLPRSDNGIEHLEFTEALSASKGRTKSLKNVGISILEFDHGERIENVIEGVTKMRSIATVAHLEADSILEVPKDEKMGEAFGHCAKPNKTISFGGDVLPDDPYLVSQWGIPNAKLQNAWAKTTGSEGPYFPKVVVIDTGIDYNHPDLAGNMWVNQQEKDGKPGVDDDGNGYIDDVHGWNAVAKTGDPWDNHGHGTHCAGIIGASTNNDLGVAGVTWKPQLIGCKFLSGSGSGYTSDAIECIDYAIAVGAAITSNSWGGGGFSQALLDAIKMSGTKGQLFVAAAGNDGRDTTGIPFYPGNYEADNIVNVASHTVDNVLSSFSNYRNVHMSAAGSGIMSTVPGNRYLYLSGTSMAAPQVSGVAALLKAAKPTATYQDIISYLRDSVEPFELSVELTKWGGKLNALGALEAMESDNVERLFLFGVPTITCQETCQQRAGHSCHEEEMLRINKNLDSCLEVIKEHSTKTYAKGLESYRRFPFVPVGCYVESKLEELVVNINTNSLGTGEFGCAAKASSFVFSMKPCMCKKDP